ncbi:hypothetical protein VE01_02704 [Pseudogymnoascus verrucosus]|uniref:AAA+ ATPase domain-containing protein n=1 Tax=Pseudogymnoascus verrucosus TaxID=342668 RepID=A0A1B8GTV9_9PEZI|nr:uncharacterized protein VE01_02704 [Pseudogymnoascus verrucosus]OBT99250.2 hypothetical protein VE01_02704 [Pseudogymnoascus verrucosus]
MDPAAETDYGMAILAEGTATYSEPIVDIVAVQGLGSHPYWTWMRNGTNWLQDLLPKVVPGARISAWGCNTHYVGRVPQYNLYQCGSSLLRSLDLHRSKNKARPLILIGHSFGGIIIKKALVTAALDTDKYSLLCESVVGIIYLGTPHTGTTAATAANKILTIVKSIDLAMVNLSIIQELEKGSSTLFELQSSMHARYKHCKVICFYETVPDSKTKVMIVPQESACLADSSDGCALETDHSGMNKFDSAHDTNFIKISEAIKSFYQLAKQSDFRVSLGGLRGEGKVLQRKGGYPRRTLSKYFSGREKELGLIDAAFKDEDEEDDSPITVAIYGMHGMGKTQVALAYIRRSKRKRDDVIWVDGDSFESARASFIGTLGLSSGDPDAISKTCRWLEERAESGGKGWLLVIDNFTSHAVSFFEHLPTDAPAGRILITTNEEDLANLKTTDSGRIQRCIPLEKMEESDSLNLFLKSCALPPTIETKEETKDLAREILHLLGNLPIAIAQAASYQKRDGRHLEGLLEVLSNKDGKMKVLGHRYSAIDTSIRPLAKLFNVAFSELEESCHDRADLLRLLSFLCPDNIPIRLFSSFKYEEIATPSMGTRKKSIWSCFRRQTRATPAIQKPLLCRNVRNLLGDTTRRQEELYQLKKASLLEQAVEGDHTTGLSYTMHDLICFLIQSLGVAPDTELTWFTLASDILYAAMTEQLEPKSEQFLLNRAMCVPHITALARLDVLGRYRVPQFAYICHLAGDYFYDTYEAAEAVNMYNIAVFDRERAYEEGLELDEYNLLVSLKDLGDAERELDNYEAAQKHFDRALTGWTAIMGPDAPVTLQLRTNMAMLAGTQAQYATAEEQYNKVIQSMGRAMETETELSYAKEGLAVIYRMQGLYVKSAECLQEVCDMQKRDQSLHEYHPQLIQSQQNLAIAYFDLGRYHEAERLLINILERCKEKYDDTHEITRGVAMNLAMVWVYQGRFEDAEGMALRAIDPSMMGFDPIKECTRSKRPYLIDALEILARTHEDLHKNAESEAEYNVVLQSRKSVLRPDHHFIFRAKEGLARVYGDSGPEKASRAFAIFEEVLDNHRKELGNEHPDTLLTLHNYGTFLKRQGEKNVGKAQRVLEAAFEGRTRVLGPEHPLTLVSKASLAGMEVVE